MSATLFTRGPVIKLDPGEMAAAYTMAQLRRRINDEAGTSEPRYDRDRDDMADRELIGAVAELAFCKMDEHLARPERQAAPRRP